MKYLVIGAGGTGGPTAAFLTVAGKDVTLIARGLHLEMIKENGIIIEKDGISISVDVNAVNMNEYIEAAESAEVSSASAAAPDVIFVCVKGYSLDSAIEFINQIADEHTLVIPVLNIFGTGKVIQNQLTKATAIDGCIYIAAEIKQPGTIFMAGDIFRIVFGFRRHTPQNIRAQFSRILEAVDSDLTQAGITSILSENIERDALQKFSYVSPMAAIGGAYGICARDAQVPGKYRELFVKLIEEVRTLSIAMNAEIPENIAEINLAILDSLGPDASTSMQRDIEACKESEVDGLIYRVLHLAQEYGVETPVYAEISSLLKEKLS